MNKDYWQKKLEPRRGEHFQQGNGTCKKLWQRKAIQFGEIGRVKGNWDKEWFQRVRSGDIGKVCFFVVVFFLLAFEDRLGGEYGMIEADLDVICKWMEAEIWSSAVELLSAQSLSCLSLLQHLRSIYRITPLLPRLACSDPGAGWELLFNCLYERLENSSVHSLRELLLVFSP